MAIHHAAVHYTLEGKLHKGNRSESQKGEHFMHGRRDASKKRIHEIEISNRDAGRACV
jgi:hypothetical protein